MKPPLYGREYELGWLHDRVIRTPGRKNLPNLTVIYGIPGIGKTSLLESFVDATLQRQNRPTILFCPEFTAGLFGIEGFAESLSCSSYACPMPWSQGISHLGEGFKQKLLAIRQGQTPRAGAYSATGEVATPHTLEKPPPRDPHGYHLSELFLQTLTETVERSGVTTGHSTSELSLIMCLDQFSDYSPSVKKWIGAVLMQAFVQSNNFEAPKIILTGQESLDAAGQSDYWEVPLGHIYELELKPIGRSSCIKWLVDEQIKPDVIDELMERTKGAPNLINEIIEDKKAIRAMEIEVQQEEDGPSVSVRQRRWLHAASTLEYVDHEGLAVILGEQDAELAMEWLKQQVSSTDGILLVDTGVHPQIFITAALKKKILAECGSRYPDRHRDFQTKINFQNRLLEKVPSSKHRNYLRRLIPIEPFDLEMIDKIYGRHD